MLDVEKISIDKDCLDFLPKGIPGLQPHIEFKEEKPS